MKLAEALTLRADLQRRIAALRDRLKRNAKVQEGDTPAEDPAVLLRELDNTTAELEDLIARINLTNCRVTADWQEKTYTLTELIARRDAMTLKISVLRDFLAEASDKVDRYSAKEIRLLSTVSVAELQKKVDDLSRDLRLLDTTLQSMNWTVELTD
ncbi:MAG: DIP1984 family protein [Clostridia bacterium]|nr:DIP1984 family protein [Clostridia bacterium]